MADVEVAVRDLVNRDRDWQGVDLRRAGRDAVTRAPTM